MAQNRKKGMAKRALSVSLVAAMLATSNTPAWASFETVETDAFFNEAETMVLENILTESEETTESKLNFSNDDLNDAMEMTWLEMPTKMPALLKTLESTAVSRSENAEMYEGEDEVLATDFKVGTIETPTSGTSNVLNWEPYNGAFTEWKEKEASRFDTGKTVAVGIKVEGQWYVKTNSDEKAVTVGKVDFKTSSESLVGFEATVNGQKVSGTVTNTGAILDKQITIQGTSCEDVELEALTLILKGGKATFTSAQIEKELKLMDAYDGDGTGLPPYVSIVFTEDAVGFEKVAVGEGENEAQTGVYVPVTYDAGKMESFVKVAPTITYHYDATEFVKRAKALVSTDLASSDYEVGVYGEKGCESEISEDAPEADDKVYINVSGAGSSDYELKTPYVAEVSVLAKNLEDLDLTPDSWKKLNEYTYAQLKEAKDAQQTGGAALAEENENTIDNLLGTLEVIWDKDSEPVILGESGIDDGLDWTSLGPYQDGSFVVGIKDSEKTGNYRGAWETELKKEKVLPDSVKEEFKNKIKGMKLAYTPSGYDVDNLFKKADTFGDISRSEYTVRSVDGDVKNVGEYELELVVKYGDYRGAAVRSGKDCLEVVPADLEAFELGGNNETTFVEAEDLVWEPGLEKLDSKELLSRLGVTLKYADAKTSETLVEGKDYQFITETKTKKIVTAENEWKTGEKVSVHLDGVKNGNYAGNDESVEVGKIVARALPELPAIPAQSFGTVKAYTSLDDLQMKDENGAVIYDYEDRLMDGDYKLKQDTDYKVSFSKMPANGEGTVTLTLTGKGNYEGSKQTVTFAVTKEAVNATFMYRFSATEGRADLPAMTYKYDDANSAKGMTFATKDGASLSARDYYLVDDKGSVVSASKYELTFKDNTAVGTATVEANGKNGYELHAVATFAILPKQISTAATVTTDGKTSNVDGEAITGLTAGFKTGYPYTGEEVTPKIGLSASNKVLVDGRYALVEGTDYEIVYQNNVNVAAPNAKDAEKPAAVVIGKGNYVFNNQKLTNHSDNSGASLHFTITPIEVKKSGVSAKDVEYAGGVKVTPDVTVKHPTTGKVLELGKDFAVELKEGGVDVGTARANVVAAKNCYNYEFGDGLEVTFKVTRKNLAGCTGVIKDGKMIIENEGVKVAESEYTVTENEDGSFTATAKEDGNYTGTLNVAPFKAPAATQARVETRTTNSVKIAWDAVEGAEGYTIWYHSEKDTTNARKILTGGDVTSWTHKGLAAGTKYFYTVKAWVKDAEGKYVFGEETSYVRGTTMPMKAKIAKVTANGGMVKVALADEAAGAEKYSMCYSKSSDFASFKVGVRTSYTTRTFTNALTKGTYYVRVKSYRDLGNNKRIYGAWSNTVKVVVK